MFKLHHHFRGHDISSLSSSCQRRRRSILRSSSKEAIIKIVFLFLTIITTCTFRRITNIHGYSRKNSYGCCCYAFVIMYPMSNNQRVSTNRYHLHQHKQQQRQQSTYYNYFTPTAHNKVPTHLFSSNNQGKNNNDNNKIDKGFNLLEIASSIVPQGIIVTGVSESWKLVWKRMMTELAPQDKKMGTYVRPSYTFNGFIGSNTEFPDEAGRYHIYTGNPCPWCHRVVLTVKLLNMQVPKQIGWTVLEDNPRQASRGGWIFSKQQPDRIFGNCKDLRELYVKLSPGYTGRCTAPLLVDVKTNTIVSNESSNIIRMLNSAKLGDSNIKNRINLVPDELKEQIDTTNEWIYKLLNNGVYRCGFATTQEAYNIASKDVLEGLQKCETILSKTQYMCGNELTESDIILLPTILRYDGVYSPLFKAGGTNVCIRADYPAIYKWLQRCWTNYEPMIEESIDIEDACASYYRQLFPLNPSGIIPSPPVTAKQIGLP